jgi:hypothetical protein
LLVDNISSRTSWRVRLFLGTTLGLAWFHSDFVTGAERILS